MRKIKLNSIVETVNDNSFGIEIEGFCRKSAYYVAQAITNLGIDCRDETNNYNHTTRTWWKIVTDSSVNGNHSHPYDMEIVSPKLYGAEGLEIVRRVCAIINSDAIDMTVDSGCGIHVHHDAPTFRAKQFKNLFNLYKMYENELDEMVAPSRRRNNNHMLHTLDDHNEWKEIWSTNRSDSKRYHKLNLCSWTAYKSVEIRHFSGSTDADKLCGWIVFTQAIVERAKTARCLSRRKNILTGIQAYGWGAEMRADGNEEKKERLTQVFADVRKWVNRRKRQLVRANA